MSNKTKIEETKVEETKVDEEVQKKIDKKENDKLKSEKVDLQNELKQFSKQKQVLIEDVATLEIDKKELT